MVYTFRGREISDDRVPKLKRSDQLELMRDWFYQRYQDPVHTCPYNGREGGYLYISGGPFSAVEVLDDQFGGIIREDLIAVVVEELEQESSEWAYTTWYEQQLGFYDDWYDNFRALTPLDTLTDNLKRLKQLTIAKDSLKFDLQKFQRMMIFSFCVTSLESFLSDVFVLNLKRKLQGSNTEVDELHIKLIREIVDRKSFHNLNDAKAVYKKFLELDIGDISQFDVIKKRHDFIHRGVRIKKVKKLIRQ